MKEIMTPNEELHQKFFNEEAALVVNLNDIELEEHIQELEMIVREGKARIIAASEEKRNRRAKKGTKGEWQIAPLDPDVSVTDSINRVKQRGARMTKLDSMRDKLTALGISDKEIEQMISKMVAQARKEPANLRAESRKREEAAKAAEDIPIQVVPNSETSNLKLVQGSSVLDLSKLKFENGSTEAPSQSIEVEPNDSKSKSLDLSKLKFS